MLQPNGLRGRKSNKTPLLRPRHVKAHLKFVKDKEDKGLDLWHKVLLTNEKNN